MWDSGVAAGSIQALVADLNDTGIGSDFGCQDYVDGTYSDWRVPRMDELCGGWTSPCIGTNCCTDPDGGIVDTSQSDPAVTNAFGDGPWSDGNAFVGVGGGHWSASGGGSDGGELDKAWDVSLPNGNVGNDAKTFELFVWPVRGTP
jgi:hypothetical protein